MNFIMYSKEDCKYCEASENLFYSRGYGYAVRDLEDPVHLNYFREQGFTTVPQIYLVKPDSLEHIGGHSDLVEWLRKN